MTAGPTSARMHLEDIGSVEPMRLVVDVVAADAIEERDRLCRLEGLPLLEKRALHNNRVTRNWFKHKARPASTLSTGTFSTKTECRVMLSLK